MMTADTPFLPSFPLISILSLPFTPHIQHLTKQEREAQIQSCLLLLILLTQEAGLSLEFPTGEPSKPRPASTPFRLLLLQFCPQP